jgi:hypothetical protein
MPNTPAGSFATSEVIVLPFTHGELKVLLSTLRGESCAAVCKERRTALDKLVRYFDCFNRANDPETGRPRRAPEPCYVNADDPTDICPGWGVFTSDGTGEILIQSCDACWHGVPDALDDEDYVAHPVCQKALGAAYAADE